MSTGLPSAVPGVNVAPLALLGVILFLFVVLAVVGIFVVIVVANRADPDPAGRRPLVVYFFAVSFFSAFAVLFGTFAIVESLVQLIGGHAAGFSGAIHPVGDAVARGAVLSSLITLVAGALLVTHLRRGLALAEGADSRRGPAGRAAQSYVSAVAFLAVLIATVATIVLLYQVIRILGPGVFILRGTRVDALRVVVPALFLAAAAGGLAIAHLRLLPPDVRRFRAGPRPPGPAPMPTQPMPGPALDPQPFPAPTSPPPAT
jgi:hypothetical protein